jgi:fermentation-respiration switch protein FrsA (DUF1100 family)
LRQRRIRARTLVLHGGADTVVDPRNGKLLANRIPDARLVNFPELGHLFFWEDPDGFTDAVTSFLLAGRGGQEVPARHRFRSGPWRRTGTRAAVSGPGPASDNRVSPEKGSEPAMTPR